MPKSLSLHRNTVEKQRKNGQRKDLARAVNEIFDTRQVKAYALVTIDADGEAQCAWDTGGVIPLWSFASTVGRVVEADTDGVEEDFKAPMVGMFPVHKK